VDETTAGGNVIEAKKKKESGSTNRERSNSLACIQRYPLIEFGEIPVQDTCSFWRYGQAQIKVG
jgi:hypothetical protein